MDVSSEGGGDITSPQFTQPETYPQIFTCSTNYILTAIPASGYVFHSWSGDLSGYTNPTQVSISDGSKSVIANFVLAANTPPVADAGMDQTVAEGDTVYLDGSGSVDSDGIIKSYEWKQAQGISVTMFDTTGATSVFTAPIIDLPTKLVFQLTVFDDQGNSATDTVTIFVQGEGPVMVSDDCSARGVAIVAVTVVDSYGNFLLSEEFECSTGEGAMSVPVGSGRRFIISALDNDGNERYHGEKTDVDILDGSNDIGTIQMERNLNDIVYFPDSNLESAVRVAISMPTGDIMTYDLEGLSELSVSERGINNIEGLQYCTNLTKLNLYKNPISDVSVLGSLTNLTVLSLWDNQIIDISALENLTNLTVLSLGSNPISDISALGNLTNLTTLRLFSNQISDISALENLTSLTNLDIGGSQINDISTLGNLTNLTSLDISGNQISDIKALVNLKSLASLELGDNQIIDISSLGNLTNLTSLDIGGNQISDISALAYLTNLNSLDLERNQISDIRTLAYLTNLTVLDLADNQIIDISVLGNLKNLTGIRLPLNQISDINSLVNLSNLTILIIQHNQIIDISALEYLTSLTWLELGDNQVSDINALENLISLTRLDLDHNQISDISALENLISLSWLDLNHNQISDITPLVSNIGIGDGDDYISLRSNPLSIDSCTQHIPTLESRGGYVEHDCP